MNVFLATLVVFVLALLAMSVGVLTGRVRLRGSCGGVAGQCDGAGEPSWNGPPGGEPKCELCRFRPGATGSGGEP